MQNGYLEMVDLIRAIRAHLDRQENVQTSVLAMLEKVPGAMDRQHEVMTMFKQQLDNGMENNRRLTESMGNLNNTLSAMDESQKASSRTVTDLIHRSRESEQLLREVMRRSERRMTALVIFFFLAVVALGLAFVRWQTRAIQAAAPVVAVVSPAAAPAPAPERPEFAVPEPPAPPPAPAEKKTSKRRKAKAAEETASVPAAVPPAPDASPSGQPDLTLQQLRPAVDEVLTPADQAVSVP